MRRCGHGGEVRDGVAISASGTPNRRGTRVAPPTSTGPCGDPGVARSDHPASERRCACSRRRRICGPRSGRGCAQTRDWSPRRAMAAQVWIHCDVDQRRIVHRRRVSSTGIGGETDLRLGDASSGAGPGLRTRHRESSIRQAGVVSRRVGVVRYAVSPAPPGADGAAAMTLWGTVRRSLASAGGAGGRCVRSSPQMPDGR